MKTTQTDQTARLSTQFDLSLRWAHTSEDSFLTLLRIICPSNINLLRKYAYSHKLKILQPKKEIISDKKFLYFSFLFQIKNSYIFPISAQNIDCRYSLGPPRRGGSNEYPQSMFLAK